MKKKLIDIIEKPVSGEWGEDCLDNEGIPVIRTTNFTNEGKLDFKQVVFRNIKKKDLNHKYLKKGDIIIEKSGGSDKQPVGRVVYFEGQEAKYLFNNFTSVLRVIDTTIWNSRYVFYSLFVNYQQGGTLAFQNKTTGLHNLKLDKYLKSFEVVERSHSEQTSVVDKLDKVRNLIESRKEQLEKIDLLVKSQFIEMFGDLKKNPKQWTFTPLNVVCDVRDGTHDSPKYYDEGFPLMTSKNFSNGEVDFSDVSLISKSDFDAINKRSKVDVGDIVMPMIGTIGHPVIVDTERPFAIKNVALIKFGNRKISNIFVKAILDSAYFFEIIKSKNRGNTQKFIALGDIRSVGIPNVPIELQYEFAHFVEQTDKSKFRIKQSLEKLETLKKALMQKYFG